MLGHGTVVAPSTLGPGRAWFGISGGCQPDAQDVATASARVGRPEACGGPGGWASESCPSSAGGHAPYTGVGVGPVRLIVERVLGPPLRRLDQPGFH